MSSNFTGRTEDAVLRCKCGKVITVQHHHGYCSDACWKEEEYETWHGTESEVEDYCECGEPVTDGDERCYECQCELDHERETDGP